MLFLLVLVQFCHSSLQVPIFEDQNAHVTIAGTKSNNNHVQTAMDLIIEANSKRGMTQYLLGGDVILKRKRNAVGISLWKWNDRKIPYIIKEADFSLSALNLIKNAINTFNKEVTCIKWIPRTDEVDYVRIRSGGGCVSSVGKDGGVQDLFLGSDCYYKGVILHEMTHATGFYHEQSRPDRDKYVQVNWDNILSDKREDFKKVTQYIDTLGTPYDYGSIMHYGKTTFSANGKPTLTPLFNPKGTMGQRDDFSLLDVWKINALYRCTRYDAPPVPVWMAGQSTSSTTTDLSITEISSISDKTTEPTAPHTTKTHNTCPEENTLPKGIPGQSRNFQVFTFTSAFRVSWEPPCTSVEITGYNLIYWNSAGSKLSIKLPPNKLTHYIGTILHKGQRYQITLAAVSKYGTGQRTDVVSTYSACGNDVFLRGNETYDMIYSPHLSQGYYEPDVACQWTVSAPEGQRLKLVIDSINLSGNCNGDFMKIDDTYLCTAPQDKKYILSDKEVVKIVFYSTQGSGPKPGGFHLIAMVEENIPRNVSVKENIPGLLVVSWQPPEGKGASFQYKIKYRVYPNVDQHVLNLDSHRTFWPIRTQPHYGRQYEIELMTVTGGKDDNTKILLVRAACGKNITVDGPGVIRNPQSNGGYEPDVQCEWKMHGTSGRNLVLVINKLDLEVSSSCQHDYLEIEQIGRFCRPDQAGNVLNIGSGGATVRFVTNMNNERTGFELNYRLDNVDSLHYGVDLCPFLKGVSKILKFNDQTLAEYCDDIIGSIWSGCDRSVCRYLACFRRVLSHPGRLRQRKSIFSCLSTNAPKRKNSFCGVRKHFKINEKRSKF